MLKILVVDDSLVFRSQIKAALEKDPDLEVVGVASDGKIAIEKLQQSSIDLMTLDLEMPRLNGIETLREMQRLGIKTRVIVSSSHSQAGSKATLDALSAGAADFVTKPSGGELNMSNAAERISKQLLPKVHQFLPKRRTATPTVVSTSTSPATIARVADPHRVERKAYPKKDLTFFKPKMVVIGSSTGGPATLEKIFEGLKGPLRCPVVIVQHMPPIFTASLALRLNHISGIPCQEAVNGEKVCKGQIYIAPGDFHLKLGKSSENVCFLLNQGPSINYVRPAVDPLFETAAQIYGAECGAFILTGMGGDGQKGAIAIKEAGGGVMIQDEKSCVVYGMPAAVELSGAYDQQGDLESVQFILKSYVDAIA